MSNIEQVVVYLTDLTRQGRFHKTGGAFVRVTIPDQLIANADATNGFCGQLIAWTNQNSIEQRFEEFSSAPAWESRLRDEYPGKRFKFGFGQTASTAFNLAVVLT